MTPVPFPAVSDGDGPDFVAFALLAALVLDKVKNGPQPADGFEAIKTLWAAAIGRPEVVDFSSQLNAAVQAGGWLERLNLPPDTKFRAAGVHYYCRESGRQIVEMLAVGVHSPSLTEPPPDADSATEEEFNGVVAAAASEAGFTLSSMSTNPDNVFTTSPGMGEALQVELNKKIDEEAARFRADLDKVFGTWKGGTSSDDHRND